MTRFTILSLVVTLCLVGLCPAPSAHGADTVLKDLTLNTAATVYVVADGKPLGVAIDARLDERETTARLLARVYDPDEKEVFWTYAEPGKDDALDAGTPRGKGQPGQRVMHDTVMLNRKGIWQIRLLDGDAATRVTLTFSREVDYGISFQNGNWHPWPGQPKEMYAWIPDRAEHLYLAGGPLEVLDHQGRPVARLPEWVRFPRHGRGTPKVALKQTGVVWTVRFPQVDRWRIRAHGFPFILCNSKDAAGTIKASLETCPDGTVVAHKWQVRLRQQLKDLLAPGKVGKTDDLILPWAGQDKSAWMTQPQRNLILLQPYGSLSSIHASLKMQNLDPDSHWAGSVGGWREFADKAAPANRWDRLEPIRGLFGGISSRTMHSAAYNLAYAATLDTPFNPYHGKAELLNRAVAAALADLQRLAEDEVWPELGHANNYPGGMAFPGAQKTFPVYMQAVAHMPEEVRAVWTEGLKHLADRTFVDNLVSARNQSSHHLVAFQCFAMGSGLDRYRKMARHYARRFAEGASPGGYHMEATGPCSSYIGMTHWHEAYYYCLSKDPVILDSIRKSYRFFNHTVAPEPLPADGNRSYLRMLGGFNFNHRVGHGFFREQYRGAKGMLDNVLPEVALWARYTENRDDEAVREAANQLEKLLEADDLVTRFSELSTPRYTYWADALDEGTWPCMEEGSYLRDLAGQLVAVKRPGYYTCVYVGKPAGRYYIRDREKQGFRTPWPDNAENTGGMSKAKPVTPFLGGGLSILWNKDYGTS
ncbi:MAG: hypothetical protein ACOCXX_00615, partial [Planctomycetota bacterium]